MHAVVANTRQSHLNPIEFDGIQRLRYQVFRERLNWDIPTVGERERDVYDDLSPVYVIVRDSNEVLACCRLLPTTGNYMLKNTFAELLGREKAPEAGHIWEISRFAVVKEARAGLGFTALPASLIRETARFALHNGITEYVFVTTVGFERLLIRLGIHLERFAAPMQIGIERSVAIRVYMDEQTIHATRATCDHDPYLCRLS